MYNACVCCKAHVKHIYINVSLLRTSIGVCIFPTPTTTVYVYRFVCVCTTYMCQCVYVRVCCVYVPEPSGVVWA